MSNDDTIAEHQNTTTGVPDPQDGHEQSESTLGTPDGQGEHEDGTDQHQDDHTPERKLRRRAQAAESERDAALATVDRLRAATVRDLTADRLANPADLTDPALGGVTLDALADDDTGLIDPGKLDAAVEALLARRPGLAAAKLRRPIPGTYSASGQGMPYRKPPRAAGWDRVLKG